MHGNYIIKTTLLKLITKEIYVYDLHHFGLCQIMYQLLVWLYICHVCTLFTFTEVQGNLPSLEIDSLVGGQSYKTVSVKCCKDQNKQIHTWIKEGLPQNMTRIVVRI